MIKPNIDVVVNDSCCCAPSTYRTVVLKCNMVGNDNVLTQDMIATPQTKYVIKYDYIIDSNPTKGTVTIPLTNEIEHCCNSDTIVYYSDKIITIPAGSSITIPEGCFLIDNSSRMRVNFTVAERDTTVRIASETPGTYQYKIQKALVFPEKCLVQFDGGSISDGVLVGNDTIVISYQDNEDIFKNVDLKGTFIFTKFGNLTLTEEIIEDPGDGFRIKDIYKHITIGNGRDEIGFNVKSFEITPIPRKIYLYDGDTLLDIIELDDGISKFNFPTAQQLGVDNKTLQYWEDSNGNHYTPGSEYVILDKNIEELSFGSHWVYTVTYMKGVITLETDIIELNETSIQIKESPCANNDGDRERFEGWFLNSNFTGDSFRPATEYIVTSNVTFYAKVVNYKYAIFIYDFTQTNVIQRIYTSDQCIDLPQIDNLLGWYYKGTTTEATNANNPSRYCPGLEGIKEIYPKLSTVRFTYMKDLNDPTIVEEQDVPAGNQTSLWYPTSWIPQNKVFEGWRIENDETLYVTQPNVPYTFITPQTLYMSLINDVQIVLDYKRSSSVVTINKAKGTTLFDTESNYGKVSLSDNAANFKGWKLIDTIADDGTSIASNTLYGKAYDSESYTSFVIPNNVHVLHFEVQWEDNVLVTLDVKEQEAELRKVEEGESLWKQNTVTNTLYQRYFSQGTILRYTNVPGGNANYSEYFYVPNKTLYGWYENNPDILKFIKKQDDTEYRVQLGNTNKQYQANWEDAPFKVLLSPNFDNWQESNVEPKVITEVVAKEQGHPGSILILPRNYTREGYKFIGWGTQPQSIIPEGNNPNVTGDKGIIYPDHGEVWCFVRLGSGSGYNLVQRQGTGNTVATHILMFNNDNEGYQDNESNIITRPSNYQITTSDNREQGLTSWFYNTYEAYKQADSWGTSTPTYVKNAVTLYAQWEKLITFKFNSDGGTDNTIQVGYTHNGSTTTQNLNSTGFGVYVGDTITIPSTYSGTRTNYQLGDDRDNIFVIGNSSTQSIPANSNITIDNYSIQQYSDGNFIILRPLWTFDVEINLDGGTLTSGQANYNIVKGGELDLSNIIVTKENYNFIGWKIQNLYNNSFINNGSSAIWSQNDTYVDNEVGNIRIIAQWESSEVTVTFRAKNCSQITVSGNSPYANSTDKNLGGTKNPYVTIKVPKNGNLPTSIPTAYKLYRIAAHRLDNSVDNIGVHNNEYTFGSNGLQTYWELTNVNGVSLSTGTNGGRIHIEGGESISSMHLPNGHNTINSIIIDAVHNNIGNYGNAILSSIASQTNTSTNSWYTAERGGEQIIGSTILSMLNNNQFRDTVELYEDNYYRLMLDIYERQKEFTIYSMSSQADAQDLSELMETPQNVQYQMEQSVEPNINGEFTADRNPYRNHYIPSYQKIKVSALSLNSGGGNTYQKIGDYNSTYHIYVIEGISISEQTLKIEIDNG